MDCRSLKVWIRQTLFRSSPYLFQHPNWVRISVSNYRNKFTSYFNLPSKLSQAVCHDRMPIRRIWTSWDRLHLFRHSVNSQLLLKCCLNENSKLNMNYVYIRRTLHLNVIESDRNTLSLGRLFKERKTAMRSSLIYSLHILFDYRR